MGGVPQTGDKDIYQVENVLKLNDMQTEKSTLVLYLFEVVLK